MLLCRMPGQVLLPPLGDTGDRMLLRDQRARPSGARLHEIVVRNITSMNLERKPFSVPEFLGGGTALATVALIAFGMRVVPSQRPLPVPTEDYASVSIQPSETSARSSIPQPRASSDVAEASRDG